jgi:hypothetical protein
MKGRWQKIGVDKIGISFGDYTRKHLTIALGATSIGSAERAPDDIIIKLFRVEVWRWSTLYLSLYSKNNSSTIASGATPIGSAGRAPDDVYSRILEQGRWRKIQWNVITPIRSELFIKSWLYNPNIFSQIRPRHAILELRYRNETRMPWFIMKVRPRDPSCEAWYTHMDALYWYVSVSMTRRKS